MNTNITTTTRQRNHLAHIDAVQGIYFVTYCLADAIPRGFLRKLEQERDSALAHLRERFGVVTAVDIRQIHRQRRRQLFAEMDRGHGCCALRESEVAQIVAESLEHFHEKRYRLMSYVVMPNHVHVVFKTFAGWPWWKVIGGSKSFTAKQVNRVLGQSGTFWQDDNWETLILTDTHVENAIEYVMNNPTRAGLKGWPWMKRF